MVKNSTEIPEGHRLLRNRCDREQKQLGMTRECIPDRYVENDLQSKWVKLKIDMARN